MTAFGGVGSRYARLLVAYTVSGLGDGVRMVALPLLAASETASPFVVALIKHPAPVAGESQGQ